MIQFNEKMAERDTNLAQYMDKMEKSLARLNPEIFPNSFGIHQQKARENQEFFCDIAPFLENKPNWIPKPLYHIDTGAMFIINYLQSGDSTSFPLQVYGRYEEQTFKLLHHYMVSTKRNLNKEVTFLDIGSGIGYFSTALASLDIPVIAIDPQPLNEQLFRRTICYNNKPIRDRITFFPVALAEDRKDGKVLHGLEGHLNNGVTSDKTSSSSLSKDVTFVTLDDIFLTDPPTIGLISIDVEGFEQRILEGGKRFFTQHKPPLIIMKLSVEGLAQQKSDPAKLFQLSQSYGYSAHLNNCSHAAIDPAAGAEGQWDTNEKHLKVCFIHSSYKSIADANKN